MSPKNYFLMVALAGAAGYAMFNYEKWQGCGSDSQDFDLVMGQSRPVACNNATMTYVDDNDSAPQLEIACDAGSQRFAMYSATHNESTCGYLVSLDERWKGGPVDTWNVHITLTWEDGEE